MTVRTKTPRKNVPFSRGQHGFTKGFYGKRKMIVNPYREGTHFYREWERGYNSAYFENLAKVQEREAANA